MANNKKKTAGTPGMGNDAYIAAMRGLRSSSAASPHKSKKVYDRKKFKVEVY